jgi:hypothetical protein
MQKIKNMSDIVLYLLLDISDRAAQQFDKVRDSASLNNVLCLE